MSLLSIPPLETPGFTPTADRSSDHGTEPGAPREESPTTGVDTELSRLGRRDAVPASLIHLLRGSVSLDSSDWASSSPKALSTPENPEMITDDLGTARGIPLWAVLSCGLYLLLH
jgi:hypothetical protein